VGRLYGKGLVGERRKIMTLGYGAKVAGSRVASNCNNGDI
jgi:hypothetical protein